MNAIITPSKLRGSLIPPPSKSYAHRALIAAALSPGTSKIKNIAMSDDIKATISCLNAIGAKIQIDGDTATVFGIKDVVKSALLDCHESGSTLRFMIPICAALGIIAKFIGSGLLPSRPIDTYKRELTKNGVMFASPSDLSLPLEISGKLTDTDYFIEGDISSQYITGLLFALPLSGGKIHITSTLQSKGYVDITCDVLKHFGVNVIYENDTFKTNARYNECDYTVENDWSQAAFWYAADDVKVLSMNENSMQTDKICVEILRQIKSENINEIDVSQIPDLLPVLAVTASRFNKKVSFVNAKRLAIKESNRLKSTAEMINNLGGEAAFTEDSLTVMGKGKLSGGTVNGCNDHRIVMAAAITATSCENEVTITDAKAVKKSYPNFWDEYKNLGGKFTLN
jgi:3-phosphoshikimate 1-carboxyvinyltransferase